MANAFLSEHGHGRLALRQLPFTPVLIYETTIIGLSVANIVTSQITVSVKLNGAGRTTGAEHNVHCKGCTRSCRWYTRGSGWRPEGCDGAG